MNEEKENLSASDAKLRQMLGSLTRVEAPKDFEFRVKARIANADSRRYQPAGRRRRLAYWLPAPALAAVLAAGVFYGSRSTGGVETANGGESPVIQNTATTPAPTAPPMTVVAAAQTTPAPETSATNPAPRVPVETPMRPVPKEMIAVSNPNPPAAAPRIKTTQKQSAEKGVSIAPDIRPQNSISEPDNPTDEFSGAQVFQTIGIETVSEDGKLKIKSIKPKSPAADSGLTVDDVIETVNGESLLKGDKIRGRKIELKKIGVKRAGEKVEIEFKSTPQ